MRSLKDAGYLLLVEVLVLLTPLPFLGVLSTIKFDLSFVVLYFLPFLFYVSLIDSLSFLEKLVLVNVIGLIAGPCIYFVLGILGTRMSSFTYLTIPGIIFFSGLIYYLWRANTCQN